MSDVAGGFSPDHVRCARVETWFVELRDRIFERFYQVHNEGVANSSGMGLGLFISRQIVELHGGAITVEFPAEGGSRFIMTLPSGSQV